MNTNLNSKYEQYFVWSDLEDFDEDREQLLKEFQQTHLKIDPMELKGDLE